MARADLLINLVKAGSRGDQSLFRRTVEALVAEERSKQHHVLADRLAEYLSNNGSPRTTPVPLRDNDPQGLFWELTPKRAINEVILREDARRQCDELIEEHHRAELLRSHNLEPRNRILLVGPPGNGKTTLAEALAHALVVPLIVVRYESVIGSYLGETAQRLRKIFEYVGSRQCVLFFDEFETIGKERGDEHETGEIKRVVSSLLLQIDALPSYVIVITASNHPELLDRAVWRRFQLRILLPPPDKNTIEHWFHQFQSRLQVDLGYSPEVLAGKVGKVSFAELEDFCTAIQRRYVLSLPSPEIKKIVSEQLELWHHRFDPHPRTSS